MIETAFDFLSPTILLRLYERRYLFKKGVHPFSDAMLQVRFNVETANPHWLSKVYILIVSIENQKCFAKLDQEILNF